MMNIVQLHERVRFWLDVVRSPRVDSYDIDNALNIAITDLVDEKYDIARMNHKGDAFELTQRVRDELYPLVVPDDTDTNLVLSTNTVTKASIDALAKKYRYLLSVKIEKDSEEYPAYPLSHDRLNVIQKNPYRRSTFSEPVMVYYIQNETGIEIIMPSGESPDVVFINYLKDPAIVVYGLEKTSTYTFTVNDTCIVVTDTAVYNSVTYVLGDVITIVAGHLNLTSGTAVFGYTNSDLPPSLHDEIAAKAAINLLITIGNIEKASIIEKKIAST